MFSASVTATLGAFVVNFAPHTFLATKHREFVANYKEGAERPVPDTLKKKLEIAEDSLKVSDFDVKFIRPFVVTGFDLYNIGR